MKTYEFTVKLEIEIMYYLVRAESIQKAIEYFEREMPNTNYTRVAELQYTEII